LEHVNAAAREQRGDDFEGRILSSCADEADGSALDVGQKRVLLCLVEAVNLIDEEDVRECSSAALAASPSPA